MQATAAAVLAIQHFAARSRAHAHARRRLVCKRIPLRSDGGRRRGSKSPATGGRSGGVFMRRNLRCDRGRRRFWVRCCGHVCVFACVCLCACACVRVQEPPGGLASTSDRPFRMRLISIGRKSQFEKRSRTRTFRNM